MREIAVILREIKDPRIPAVTSVTGIQVSKDLKTAKVFFSALEGDPKEVRKGLTSAAGFIRRELAARLNLRNTPELFFTHDDSLAYGANIQRLLRQIGDGGDVRADGDEEEEKEDTEGGGRT